MTRVSLTEDYDDRSVIAKLNKMEAIANSSVAKADDAVASAQASAQSAQETADRFAGSVGAVVQNANAQINASKAQVNEAKAEVDSAKAEVDATVSTVAQAVQTASNASSVATQAAGQVLDKVNKTGTDTPQVISGTGGLQIAGDLDVGTDLTVAGNTHLGDQVEVAGMAIEMDGLSTTLSNANGIKVNGKNMSKVAVTDIQNHFTDYQYFDSWYTYGPNQLVLKGSQPTNWKIIGASNGTESATALQFNNDTLYIRNPNTLLPTVSSSSLGVVNKAFVASTDGTTNNLLHTEGNENATGLKRGNWVGQDFPTPPINAGANWLHYCDITKNNGSITRLSISSSAATSSNNAIYCEALAATYTRVVPYISTQVYADAKIVSLFNNDTSKWEIWMKSSGTGGRSTSYVVFRWLEAPNLVTIVNEIAEGLPSNVSYVKYLVGSE